MPIGNLSRSSRTAADSFFAIEFGPGSSILLETKCERIASKVKSASKLHAIVFFIQNDARTDRRGYGDKKQPGRG